MKDLAPAFAALLRGTPVIIPPTPVVKRGRPPIGERSMTRTERKRADRVREREQRLENIAVLDMETEPFDNTKSAEDVKPFLAVLYRDDAQPVVIWEEDNDKFISAVLGAIEALPGRFTIYAHNGGKFDFMFLLSKLRGFVSFKGRGIMSARVGHHEIRDSFHIIPEKLANWQKDTFDYTKLTRANRAKYRDEIIRYCTNDCAYLLDIVKKFIAEFGLKLSIGQASMSIMKGEYNVKCLGEQADAFLRNYFFGGRVECLGGRGAFGGVARRDPMYKLFDVNSMYPFVMANRQHPIGNSFTCRRGLPNAETVFIELTCRNHGALVRRGGDGEMSAEARDGLFRTTVWEYDTALKYDLIENVRVNWCIDFAERSDFSRVSIPLYAKKQADAIRLKTLTMGSREYNDCKKDYMFDKFLLNTGYGKFAQNPRKFKECFITDPELEPPEDCKGCLERWKKENGWHENPEGGSLKCMSWGPLPHFKCDDYWIWQRPTPRLRFNNVATAASITGAARAVLMEAIALADDPIYCDTDSIIARGLNGLNLHDTELGAWKIEHGIDEILIAGKKLYACKVAGFPDGHADRIKIRSKGVAGLTWRDLERAIDDEMIEMLATGTTMNKYGEQFYMRRNVRATVARGNHNRLIKRRERLRA